MLPSPSTAGLRLESTGHGIPQAPASSRSGHLPVASPERQLALGPHARLLDLRASLPSPLVLNPTDGQAACISSVRALRTIDYRAAYGSHFPGDAVEQQHQRLPPSRMQPRPGLGRGNPSRRTIHVDCPTGSSADGPTSPAGGCETYHRGFQARKCPSWSRLLAHGPRRVPRRRPVGQQAGGQAYGPGRPPIPGPKALLPSRT